MQNFLGRLTYLEGDYTASAMAFRTSLSLGRSSGDKEGIFFSFDGLACLAVAQGQFARALKLAGASAAQRERFPLEIVRYDQDEVGRIVASAREALGQREADAAWQAGRAMPLDQAIELAMAEDAGP